MESAGAARITFRFTMHKLNEKGGSDHGNVREIVQADRKGEAIFK